MQGSICCFLYQCCVFLEGSESSSSSASSESEGEGEGEGKGEGKGKGEAVEGVVEWTPSGAQRALGEWEKYTTVSRS